MTTIRNLQDKHSEFIRLMGWDRQKTPLEALCLIGEELGELVEELDPNNDAALKKVANMMMTVKNLSHQFRKLKDQDIFAIEKELADILLRTLDLATELHIDLQAAAEEKIHYNLDHIEDYKRKGRKI